MLYLDSAENKQIRELRNLLRYLDLSLKDNLGVNTYSSEISGIEKITNALAAVDMFEGEDYVYNTGMTKLVIDFNKYDYVVKIPFNCYEDINFIPSDDNDYDDTITYKFSNANKDYDWLDITNNWDYCELESKLYEYAVEENVEQFFLPIIPLCKTKGGYPIYIQEKAKMFFTSPFEKSYFSNYDEIVSKTLDTLDLDLFSCLPYEWSAYMCNNNSINKIYDFLYFIINLTSINADLHDANVGFTQKGRPVIIDYGSFSY